MSRICGGAFAKAPPHPAKPLHKKKMPVAALLAEVALCLAGRTLACGFAIPSLRSLRGDVPYKLIGTDKQYKKHPYGCFLYVTTFMIGETRNTTWHNLPFCHVNIVSIIAHHNSILEFYRHASRQTPAAYKSFPLVHFPS